MWDTKKNPLQIEIDESPEHDPLWIYRTILHTLHSLCPLNTPPSVSHSFPASSCAFLPSMASCYVVPPTHPNVLQPLHTHSLCSPGLAQLHMLTATTPSSQGFPLFSLHKTPQKAPQNQASTHLSHRIPDSSHTRQPPSSLYCQAWIVKLYSLALIDCVFICPLII